MVGARADKLGGKAKSKLPRLAKQKKGRSDGRQPRLGGDGSAPVTRLSLETREIARHGLLRRVR